MEIINKYILYSRQVKIVFKFLNILGMFKLAQSYCYVSCMCLWFCLSLDNYLGILLRDLPRGRMVTGGKVCKRIWEGIYHDCHLWWFWNSPLNRCRILKSWQNVLKMYAPVLAMPESYSLLHCAGVWPSKHNFNTIQHLQEEEIASSSDLTQVTGTAAG